MGENSEKLDQFLTLDLDQFLTLETPNLGPIFNSTAHIYIYNFYIIYIRFPKVWTSCVALPLTPGARAKVTGLIAWLIRAYSL